MSKRKVIKDEKRRLVKNVKAIARKLQGTPKPTLIEQSKKRVSRAEQKIKDKKELP